MINEKLLKQTVADAPPGDLYIFGYGSLMWRPGFCYRDMQCARVFGYSRRCAVFSNHYRGTPRRPGLVLGLDAGGSCNGVCYRVAAKHKARVIRYLFMREMFADVYFPRYVYARGVNEATRRRVLTFIVRRSGRQYAPPMSDTAAAAIIRRAAGRGGSNSDYMHNTQQYLQQMGVSCPMLTRLCRLL